MLSFDKKAYNRSIYEAWSAHFKDLYGEEIGDFLAKRASAMVRKANSPCMDNFRIAEVGNVEAESAYEAAVTKGCCGFFDEKITHFKTGRTFLLGFNYGH